MRKILGALALSMLLVGAAHAGQPVWEQDSGGADATDPTNHAVWVETLATGKNVADTPTIQNASYVSGNCMGGFQTVVLGSSASVLSGIGLSSQGGLATAKQIYVFDANPSGSTCTDKSTFTIATADLSKLVTTFQITPAAPTGTTKTNGVSSNLGLGIPSGGTNYIAIVETTTETPASASDLVLNVSAF